jgi:hypothetical protein
LSRLFHPFCHFFGKQALVTAAFGDDLTFSIHFRPQAGSGFTAAFSPAGGGGKNAEKAEKAEAEKTKHTKVD